MQPPTPNPDFHFDGHDSPMEAAILRSSILVVDDQSAHLHLLMRLLQDAGYENVSATADPRQVRALHREHRYDLILLDIQMPALDGFGVMGELRSDAGGHRLPVIVLTAQPGHKLQALEAGARDFISKPFEAVEVKLRIHHMLEMHQLNRRLLEHNTTLERLVAERTAALQDSEARYRSLTELAVDWYWEQNDAGVLTRASGLVVEMLGITGAACAGSLGAENDLAVMATADRTAAQDSDHWNPDERETLRDNIRARRPFLDLLMHRRRDDGTQQQFRVSGEPMFDRSCRFTGYRGLGVEVLADR